MTSYLHEKETENLQNGDVARKFFVTGVKDLSTGVKYMGFQSGFLVLFVPVSRI